MAPQKGDGEQNKDNPTSIRRHVAFPSRQFLQVPDSLVVCPCRNVLGRVAVNLFRLTACLLPHYGSHSAPWAQQAFTCCADLNDGSALFFGWSEPYSRQTSIYVFHEKFLNNIAFFLGSHFREYMYLEPNYKKTNKLKNATESNSHENPDINQPKPPTFQK